MVVIEHTFVTTLPADQALRQASEFLGRGGFVAQTQTAFALDGAAWTSIDVRRGKPRIARTSTILDLPQQIRIEWDRGRMSVAASIGNKHSAKKRSQLLLAIVNGLEDHLARRVDESQARQEWARIDAELKRSGRWYKLWRWSAVLLVIALWMGIAVYLVMRRR